MILTLTEQPQKHPHPEIKLMLLMGLRGTFRTLWATSAFFSHRTSVMPPINQPFSCLKQRLPLDAYIVIGPGVNIRAIKK